MAPTPRILIAFGALLGTSSAILVAQDSPCAVNCGNVLDATPSDDIVCSASEYDLSAQGTIFKNCVECEVRSDYTTDDADDAPATSDLQAMLYNLRSAVAGCVFEGDGNPCMTSTACGPLKDAIEYESLAPNATAYGYCSVWNSQQVPKCNDCLRLLDGGYYLNNYLQVLSGACDLLLPPPATIPLDGEIFSTTEQVNVTAPTPTSDFVSDASHVGGLTYGAVAGIVIGAVVLVLVLVGCGVVLNGKRKRRAYLRQRERMHKQWPGGAPGGGRVGGGGEMFETPISQRPLRGTGWADSPISATTDHSYSQYPQYFSPYTSQYNSPVSAAEAQGPHVAWPAEKAQQQQQQLQNIGVALSPDDEGVNPGAAYWGDAKGKDRAAFGSADGGGGGDREGYELQEGINSGGGHQYPYVPPPPPPQAPMLNHPGYGRHGATHPDTTG